MAKAFHVKVKDMTPEEREAYELHGKKHGLIAKMNKEDKEWKEWKEKRLEAADPEYAKLKMKLKKLDEQEQELRLMIRKKRYDLMPEEQKRILDKLGMNPHRNKIIHRSTGTFIKKGSYTIKED